MTVHLQNSLQPDQIKMRWMEPYVSAAANNKNYRTIPRGIYAGFEVTPGPGSFEVTIDTATPSGISGYEGGNFDSAAAIGWSVASHEDLDGHTCVILIQRGVNSEHIFDLTAYQGGNVFAVLDVHYALGIATSAEIKIVDDAELDANPTLLVIKKIEVPPGSPIQAANLIDDDPLYPRVLPFANPFKFGFMSKSQAEILDILAGSSGASNAFEEEYIVSAAGPQTITIPGAQSYVVGGNDLFIFRNGLKLRRGRDYNEIDRGDGFGNDVEFLGPLRIDDRILFRGQEYAVSLTNNLVVKDEYSVISGNVTALNFSGTGVVAVPDGGGQVRIVIPSPSGTSAGTAKYKENTTGTDIPNGRVVHLEADGTVVLCDPTNPTHKPYGVTSGVIVDGNFGFVILSGNAENALLGIGGFTVGDTLYLSHAGDGSLTRTPPNPASGAIFVIGIADTSSGSSGTTPTDVVLQISRI